MSDPWDELQRPGPSSAEVAGVTIRRGSRVRLHPRAGGDIFDLALAGKLAAVESLEEDDEGRVHVTVTLDDDPGRDLGAARVLGHRFFFRLDEIEPVEGGDEQAASAGTRILVAGVGNIFLGDDGFGVAVANRLAERELPEGFVDAAPRGEAPGTLSVIEPELDLDEVVLDTHGMDPLRVIALARALGGIPPRVLVVACEPETVVHGEHDEELVGELSAPVRAAVDEAATLVCSVVEAEIKSTRKAVRQ